MPPIASVLPVLAIVREATYFAVITIVGRYAATSPHHASLPQQ
jgi:hypothetical protein